MSNEKDLLFKECIDSLIEIKKLSDVSELLKENQQKLGAEIQKYYRVDGRRIVIDMNADILNNIITKNMEEVVEIFINDSKK